MWLVLFLLGFLRSYAYPLCTAASHRKRNAWPTGIPGPVHGSDHGEGWLAHWPVVRLSLLDAAAGGALQDVSSTDVATVALQSQPLELQSRPEHDGDKVMVVGHGRGEAQLVQLGPLLL